MSAVLSLPTKPRTALRLLPAPTPHLGDLRLRIRNLPRVERSIELFGPPTGRARSLVSRRVPEHPDDCDGTCSTPHEGPCPARDRLKRDAAYLAHAEQLQKRRDAVAAPSASNDDDDDLVIRTVATVWTHDVIEIDRQERRAPPLPNERDPYVGALHTIATCINANHDPKRVIKVRLFDRDFEAIEVRPHGRVVLDAGGAEAHEQQRRAKNEAQALREKGTARAARALGGANARLRAAAADVRIADLRTTGLADIIDFRNEHIEAAMTAALRGDRERVIDEAAILAELYEKLEEYGFVRDPKACVAPAMVRCGAGREDRAQRKAHAAQYEAIKQEAKHYSRNARMLRIRGEDFLHEVVLETREELQRPGNHRLENAVRRASDRVRASWERSETDERAVKAELRADAKARRPARPRRTGIPDVERGLVEAYVRLQPEK